MVSEELENIFVWINETKIVRGKKFLSIWVKYQNEKIFLLLL